MKTILLIFLFILIFNWLVRALFPVMLRGMMKNMQKRYGNNTSHTTTKKEGEVSVDSTPQQSRKGEEKIGSYVDYEEVK